MEILQFKDWLNVQTIAEKWFNEDGTAKTRAMTQTMISDTMKSYKLELFKAAELLERAILYNKNQHVVGGEEAYWSLVKEMAGTGAIVNNCNPTADFQVQGSCSNVKKRKRK